MAPLWQSTVTSLVLFLSLSESSIVDPLLRFIPPQSVISLAETYYKTMGQQQQATADTRQQTTRRYGRQHQIPDQVPFPCDVTQGRSPQRPISVHALRPGDVDIVAAMGDSLSAAFGAKATDIFHVLVANRGVAFSSGGEGTWRDTLTLPNILRQFNPNLMGYATGDALSWQRPAELNVAEGAATVQDMPHQALLLVKRMKDDPRVDFNRDWKLITLLIGYNDICTVMCTTNLTKFLDDERSYLLAALDVLYGNMPRVFINVIPPANLIAAFERFRGLPPVCRDLYHATECACLNKLRLTNNKRQQRDMLDQLGQFVEDITKLRRYQGRSDFAVVAQPFNRGGNLPTRWSPTFRKNLTDYSFFAPDCFHFSQKGHALSASSLWNNMLEPVGLKSRDASPGIMRPFLCPTPERSYFFTYLNTPPL